MTNRKNEIKIKREQQEAAMKKAAEEKALQEGFYKKKRKLSLLENYFHHTRHVNYFLQRANMIAEQLNTDNIQESVDGMKKTKEYLLAEYQLFKSRASDANRRRYFVTQELLQMGMTTEQIDEEWKKFSIVGLAWFLTGAHHSFS